MGYTIYKSTDASAPVLSGQVGKLTDLLDACLVNGYGSKTAAGWTIEFTATNKRVWRAPSGTSRCYWKIDDTAPGTGGAKEAYFGFYESMSDINTGTGGAYSICVRKSAAADATARAWIVVADGRTCIVFILTGDYAGNYYAFHLGEIYSFVPGDAYNGFMLGRWGENTGLTSAEFFGNINSDGNATHSGHYMQRSYTGTGTAAASGKHLAGPYGSTTFAGSLPYPNGADGGLYLSPVFINHTGYQLRGHLRGVYAPLHAYTSFTDGDTVAGMGTLAGKTFLVIRFIVASSSSPGVVFIETSDTLPNN